VCRAAWVKPRFRRTARGPLSRMAPAHGHAPSLRLRRHPRAPQRNRRGNGGNPPRRRRSGWQPAHTPGGGGTPPRAAAARHTVACDSPGATAPRFVRAKPRVPPVAARRPAEAGAGYPSGQGAPVHSSDSDARAGIQVCGLRLARRDADARPARSMGLTRSGSGRPRRPPGPTWTDSESAGREQRAASRTRSRPSEANLNRGPPGPGPARGSTGREQQPVRLGAGRWS
jgi:hypothetical protein